MPSSCSTNRIEWMDYAKGIAIVLVVYSHVAGSLLTTHQIPERGAIAFSCFLAYTFHVPVFFFFAGFFAQKVVDRDPFRLVNRSITLVLLPYFCWSLAYCAVALALAPYVHNKISWTGLVGIVYRPYLHFWFLYALFLAHLMLYATRSVPRRWLILLAAASYAASFTLDEASIAHAAMHFFLFYAIGAAVPGLMAQISGRGDRVLVSFLLLLGASGLSFASGFDYQAPASLPATAVGVWFTLELAHWLASRSLLHFLRICGNLSLPIYILHTFASAGTRAALEAGGVHGTAVQLCASTVLGVGLPIAAYAALSRWKLLGWFALGGSERSHAQPFSHNRQETRAAIASPSARVPEHWSLHDWDAADQKRGVATILRSRPLPGNRQDRGAAIAGATDLLAGHSSITRRQRDRSEAGRHHKRKTN